MEAIVKQSGSSSAASRKVSAVTLAFVFIALAATVVAASHFFFETARKRNIRSLPIIRTDDYVNGLAFTPDGKTLISLSDDALRLWDTRSGKQVKTLQVPGGEASSLAISPDGLTVLSTSWKSSDEPPILAQWDLASGQLLRIQKLNCDHGPEPAVAYNPNGHTYATLCGSQNVSQWTLNGDLVHSQDIAISGNSIAFSPNGRYLALGGDLGLSPADSSGAFVLLWDTTTGTGVGSFNDKAGGTSRRVVAFSPDGHTLALSEGGPSIALWNASTGQLLRRLTQSGPPSDYVFSIAFSPDSKMLGSVGGDDSIRLWEVGNARLLDKLTTNAESLDAIAFSPNGQIIAAGGDKFIQLFDVASGEHPDQTQIPPARPAPILTQQEPETTPSSKTGESSIGEFRQDEVEVLRWEPEQITALQWFPRLFIRNGGDRTVINVRVDVDAYDASGIMQDDGVAIVSSIPPHTTAVANCCLNMLSGPMRLSIGTPRYQ